MTEASMAAKRPTRAWPAPGIDLRLCLLVLLILQSSIMAFTGPAIRAGAGLATYIDELAVLAAFAAALALPPMRGDGRKLVGAGALFALYQFGLLLINGLPLLHILQIVLNVKLIAIYLLWSGLADAGRERSLRRLWVALQLLLFLCFLFSVAGIAFPTTMSNLIGFDIEKRGVFGFGVPGFFPSRTSAAQFALICLLIALSAMIGRNGEGRRQGLGNLIVLGMALFVLLASGSRKELLFLIVMVPVAYLLVRGTAFRLALIPISPLLVTVALALLQVAFSEVNDVALSDSYVRLKILLASLEILADYAPFGSGPGTFGSTFSIGYGVLYSQYGIGEEITGFGNDVRGPIYDLFFFTSLAEFGVGILYYIAVPIVMLRCASGVRGLSGILIDVHFLKVSLCLMLYVMCLVTPIFNNWVGILIVSIIAMLNRSSSVKR